MLFEKYVKELDEQSKKLIKFGFFLFDIEDLNELHNLKKELINFLKEINSSINELDEVHKFIKISELNEIRLGFYNRLNKDGRFAEKYLKLGYNAITNVAGTELAANKNVNFSMQLPNDSSSKLPIHMDTFSGESAFQINLWVPLTDASSTNSMFIFNPKFSKTISNDISKYEKQGLEQLLSKHREEYIFLKVPYGKGIVFTPTCLHGNVINRTVSTRISFNCRYKNLFSPYNKDQGNEKKLGTFYKPITPKAATIIGLNNKLPWNLSKELLHFKKITAAQSFLVNLVRVFIFK